ncbi:MAG: hypothetical protein KKA05_09900 [Alphaproteobacteria bacterium]|nr:hypothetical protein [Alphaproteobacteria bacterium]
MLDASEELNNLVFLKVKLQLQLKGHYSIIARTSDSHSLRFARELECKIEKIETHILALKKGDEPELDYVKLAENRRVIREANVTSLTYERAKKIMFKDADGFISGRRY